MIWILATLLATTVFHFLGISLIQARVTFESVQAKTLGLGKRLWWMASFTAWDNCAPRNAAQSSKGGAHKVLIGATRVLTVSIFCALGRPFARAGRQLRHTLWFRRHKKHEAPKMTQKVLQKLVIQVWSFPVPWVHVEIFRIVLWCLRIAFRPRSICPSKEFARIRTELLLVTTIRVGQTTLWLPIIFSSLCWEFLFPGKLWRWNDLEQGSTLCQGFRRRWLSFHLKFRENWKAIAQQVMKRLMSIFYIKTSCFQCCDYFVLKLSGVLYIWGSC